MLRNKTNSPHLKGVTLIELSVVIAILLVLISVLFVGARYYRDSANKASCITQLSSIQKALRSYQNTQSGSVGDAITKADFIGSDKPLPAEPFCPSANGVYTLKATIPASGVAFAVCSQFDSSSGSVDPSQGHTPTDLTSW